MSDLQQFILVQDYMGFKKNNKFSKRLAERVKHTITDWGRLKELLTDQHIFYQRDAILVHVRLQIPD